MAGSSNAHTRAFRYYIVYLLDNLPEGAKFQPSALHITVLPWFALETDEKPFIRWFYDHFDRVQAFEAQVGQAQYFGPKKDVPVHLIDPYDKFFELHKLALSWFGDLGARWAERDPYVGDDFKPHVAERKGLVLKTGDKLLVDSISLIKAKRHDDGVREVAAKANLHA